MVKRKPRTGPKRRYVRAETIELVRDPTSGVLVYAQGGDLGAKARERIESGEIILADRSLVDGGRVTFKGAHVKNPSRIDELIETIPPPDGIGRLEYQAKLRDAAYKVRSIMEKARLRARTVALYQSAVAHSRAEMSDAADAAREKMTRIGRHIGWEKMHCLTDAIIFEQTLSQKQDLKVISALVLLVDYFEL